ncbi:ABC transporter permease [Billgrantia endophytica]|uniref:ABC transporter n=1 Tax=Billgrantia endophytica TaxID=2033802 RepID=A0A2N7TXZ9_9GAMM|nr:ABC transporter permease [Halomonas endophytica]PMR73052.1 ABC transporter [Halomonas endophytica]
MMLWHWLRPFLSIFVRFLRISYLEVKSKYQRTKLGVLWIPSSTLLFTAMLALVFRPSETMPLADFYLYVLTGFVLWQFIQGSIAGSTDVIQKKLEFAIHNNLTLAGLFGKQLVDRLFEFSINLLLVITALVVVGLNHVGVNLLAFLPFILIVAMTSIAVAYLINLMTVFYPDLAELVKTGTRFMFFASPIFWLAEERAGVRQFLSSYNPVSYYLGMIRQVFGIEPFSTRTWLFTLIISSVLCLTAFVAYFRSRDFVRNIK